MILFATLGHTPKMVLAPLRNAGFDALHVFYGVPQVAEGKEALKQVKITCANVGVKLVAHPVKDPFDYTHFLQAFTTVHKELTDRGEEHIWFNASGGTRVMIMAATIFCFTQDVTLVYHGEHDPKDGRIIPLKAFHNLDNLGRMPLRILRRLQHKGPADMSTLANELNIAPSTLTLHVQNLLHAETITVEREGKRRVAKLVPDLAHINLIKVGADLPSEVA